MTEIDMETLLELCVCGHTKSWHFWWAGVFKCRGSQKCTCVRYSLTASPWDKLLTSQWLRSEDKSFLYRKRIFATWQMQTHVSVVRRGMASIRLANDYMPFTNVRFMGFSIDLLMESDPAYDQRTNTYWVQGEVYGNSASQECDCSCRCLVGNRRIPPLPPWSGTAGRTGWGSENS